MRRPQKSCRFRLTRMIPTFGLKPSESITYNLCPRCSLDCYCSTSRNRAANNTRSNNNYVLTDRMRTNIVESVGTINMTLAIFDLDKTLIPFDSDDHWGAFLVAQGLVSAAEHGDAVERFGTAYREGRLDIHEYSRFVLSPLTQHPPARLEQLRADFVRAQVVPRIASAARELVASHRAAGHTLLIITATNRFVTQPIAELFDVPHLLACEPEIVDGRYTGEIIGIPTY